MYLPLSKFESIQRVYIALALPKKFTELLDEYEYNPSIRGDAQLKLLFSYITEMQIRYVSPTL